MTTEILPLEYCQPYTKKGLEFHKQLVKNGEVKSENELAVLLLWGSCISRRNAIHYGIVEVPDRKFLFDSAEDMFFSIIRKKPEMFQDWIEHTNRYIESNYNSNFRPTIDRINNNGHYELDNIQVLTKINNFLKMLPLPTTSPWYGWNDKGVTQ